MNRTWLGVGVVAALALALILVLASGGDETPTTTNAAPTAAPAGAPPTTTAPTTSSPAATTTVAPTTTLDPAVRAAEVEALVRDLEFTLVKALYDQDSKGLAEVIAGKALWERLQGALESPLEFFSKQPTRDEYRLSLETVVLDRGDCIVAEVEEDPTAFLNDDGEVEQLLIALWPIEGSLFGWRVAERWAAGTPNSEWKRSCDLQERDWRP